MGRLDGKVVFITGAARGQGRNHAIRLAKEGAKIIAVDICANLPMTPYSLASREDLQETVHLVKSAGGEIQASEADVRSPSVLAKALDDGVERFGRLDAVSANAGVFSAGSATELTDEQWREVIEVDLTGAWNTCKVAIPHIIKGNGGGSIVLTSSIVGLQGSPNSVHYAAAKHGLVGVMRTLALELAPHFIRVNSLHPSTCDTPMLQNEAMYKLFCPELPSPTKEDFTPRSKSLHVMPIAWITPDDVSNALIFLVSDESRYITGVALPVDGGATIARPVSFA